MGNSKVEGSNFYSSFSNDIKSLLDKGKRIAAFVEIEDKEYPQGYIKRSAGTPNCVLSINKNGIDVVQLGKNIGLMMKNKKEILFQLKNEQISSIELSVKKVTDTIGGRYVLFINLVCNGDNPSLKFWIDSLKPAILIWNSQQFSTNKKIVSEALIPLLSIGHLETISEDIESISTEIPLFYEKS